MVFVDVRAKKVTISAFVRPGNSQTDKVVLLALFFAINAVRVQVAATLLAKLELLFSLLLYGLPP